MSAKAAIESVIDCNDQRLTVRCNSNGYEPLENFEILIPELIMIVLNQIEDLANSIKLFNDTNAKFCMLCPMRIELIIRIIKIY